MPDCDSPALRGGELLEPPQGGRGCVGLRGGKDEGGGAGGVPWGWLGPLGAVARDLGEGLGVTPSRGWGEWGWRLAQVCPPPQSDQYGDTVGVGITAHGFGMSPYSYQLRDDRSDVTGVDTRMREAILRLGRRSAIHLISIKLYT